MLLTVLTRSSSPHTQPPAQESASSSVVRPSSLTKSLTCSRRVRARFNKMKVCVLPQKKKKNPTALVPQCLQFPDPDAHFFTLVLCCHRSAVRRRPGRSHRAGSLCPGVGASCARPHARCPCRPRRARGLSQVLLQLWHQGSSHWRYQVAG